MNKTYIVPQMRVINIASEGLVAGSGDKMRFTSSEAATHNNPDGDVLSNQGGRGIWDEE